MNRELRGIAIEQHAVPAVIYGAVVPVGIVSIAFAFPVAWSFIEAGSYSYGTLWAFGAVVIGTMSVGCAGRCRRKWREYKDAIAAAGRVTSETRG